MKEVGTENGQGLKGLWIVDPLTEARDYKIPLVYVISEMIPVGEDYGIVTGVRQVVVSWHYFVKWLRN